VLAEEISLNKKLWHVLGFFDGENAELEKICEYNINQLEDDQRQFSFPIPLPHFKMLPLLNGVQ
jgi:hypothetical protein